MCSLLTRPRQAKKLFVDFPSLRATLDGERLLSERELCGQPHQTHWTAVLLKLKAGLPSAALQAIRVWKNMHNAEADVLDWLAGKKVIDSNDKAKACAEARALYDVLGPWGARSEVAMLGAYVRCVIPPLPTLSGNAGASLVRVQGSRPPHQRPLPPAPQPRQSLRASRRR